MGGRVVVHWLSRGTWGITNRGILSIFHNQFRARWVLESIQLLLSVHGREIPTICNIKYHDKSANGWRRGGEGDRMARFSQNLISRI